MNDPLQPQDPPEPRPEESDPQPRSYRYYPLLMAAFVTVLISSNVIGPAKACRIVLPLVGAFTFGAGNLFFPLSYIFGDVLTEVYGYAQARKVIWAGFGAMIFVTFMSYVIIHIPGSPDEPFNETLQPALEVIFGNTWRITIGSLAAFWIGDFANSYVMARMKVMTRGRFLWMRTIGSTIVGQGVDSLVFYPVAFYGIWTNLTMAKVVTFNWIFKVSIEAVFTPITYLVVNFLKRAENEDFYDRDTDFTPFSLQD